MVAVDSRLARIQQHDPVSKGKSMTAAGMIPSGQRLRHHASPRGLDL